MSTPLKGRDAVIKIAGSAVGYAKGYTITPEMASIDDYKFGSDKPAVHEFGNRSFRITLDKMYIDKTHATQILAGTKVAVVVQPAGTGTGKEEYTFSDVVLSRWTMTVVQDGVIAESIEGEGKSATISTQA